jgi:hypothetical protein
LICAKYGYCVGVTTLGVGFPASFPMETGGSLASGVSFFGVVGMIGVLTLGVSFSMASCDGVAKNGVGFPASYLLASFGPSAPKILSFGDVATEGVATKGDVTLGVEFPYRV